MLGFKTKTTPFENRDAPLNPMLMLLSYGASWVGQAHAGNPHHLADMIAEALAHRGFSYLHILSPCVTFDKTSMTYRNLGMAVRDLPDGHGNADLIAAMAEARDTAAPALRIFFREGRPTLGDNMDDIARAAGGAPPERARAAGYASPARPRTPAPIKVTVFLTQSSKLSP